MSQDDDLKPITLTVGSATASMSFFTDPPRVEVSLTRGGYTMILPLVELVRIVDMLRAGTRTLPRPDWP